MTDRARAIPCLQHIGEDELVAWRRRAVRPVDVDEAGLLGDVEQHQRLVVRAAVVGEASRGHRDSAGRQRAHAGKAKDDGQFPEHGTTPRL